MRISVIARKGGVGKTSTSVSLAAGLAEEGRRTLLVDLDSQGNVGLSLGLGLAELVPSINDVLMDGEPIAEAIRPTEVSDLHIVTCDHRFEDAAARLGRLPAEERVSLLGEALDELGDRYEAVVFDTGGGMDLVVANALQASDAYVICMQPEKLSMDGLLIVRREIQAMQAQYGIDASLLGILFTMVDPRLVAARETIEEVRRHLGEAVYQVEIPRTTRIAEAPYRGEPIFTAFPTSTGSEAYRAMVRETLQRARAKGLT